MYRVCWKEVAETAVAYCSGPVTGDKARAFLDFVIAHHPDWLVWIEKIKAAVELAV